MSQRPFDVEVIRRDFPILSRSVRGRALVYLDSAATSQKPRQVLDAVRRYDEEANANAHRGVHALAEEATRRYEDARERVARFVGVTDAREVVFVRNATEGVNLVAHAWGDANVREGDEVLVTVMEHHSNLVPWHLLARRTGARVRAVPVRDDGRLDLDAFRAMLSPRVRLVAVTHVSNVLATINPVADLVRAAREAGARVLVDGAQAVPHLPVVLRGGSDGRGSPIGADFYVFSGHKMLGPMGIGVVVVARERHDEMLPFLGGGEMIREVEVDSSSYADPPWRFEAGTPNVEGAVGLAAALEYLSGLGMEAVAEHTRRLGARAREVLREVPGVRLFGPDPGPDSSGSVVSFTLEGVHPHDIAQVLDRFGVAIRAGHHCAQPLMRRLGVPATARASFYLYNTDEEVDFLARCLVEATREFAPARAGWERPVDGHLDRVAPPPHAPPPLPDPVLPDATGDGESDREVLLDHYLHPSGQDPVDGAQVEWWGRNPLCGDEVVVRARLEGERISGLQVLGRGCSVSVASGSILASQLKGRTLIEAFRLLRGLKALLRGEPLPGDLDLGDLTALRGLKDLPVRVKCALLPWTTFEEGMERAGVIEGGRGNGADSQEAPHGHA